MGQLPGVTIGQPDIVIDFLKNQRATQVVFVQIALDSVGTVKVPSEGFPIQGFFALGYEKYGTVARHICAVTDLVFGVVGEERITRVNTPRGQTT